MEELYFDIRFFSEKIPFSYPPDKQNKLLTIVKAILYDHECESAFVNIIFCSDDYLLDINKTHLNHNYYTDIITFEYQQLPDLEGDIFISIDRVAENAQRYKVSFLKELNRVIFHGFLHLCGYKDKTPEERAEMQKKEDYYLNLYQQSFT